MAPTKNTRDKQPSAQAQRPERGHSPPHNRGSEKPPPWLVGSPLLKPRILVRSPLERSTNRLIGKYKTSTLIRCSRRRSLLLRLRFTKPCRKVSWIWWLHSNRDKPSSTPPISPSQKNAPWCVRKYKNIALALIEIRLAGNDPMPGSQVAETKRDRLAKVGPPAWGNSHFQVSERRSKSEARRR